MGVGPTLDAGGMATEVTVHPGSPGEFVAQDGLARPFLLGGVAVDACRLQASGPCQGRAYAGCRLLAPNWKTACTQQRPICAATSPKFGSGADVDSSMYRARFTSTITAATRESVSKWALGTSAPANGLSTLTVQPARAKLPTKALRKASEVWKGSVPMQMSGRLFLAFWRSSAVLELGCDLRLTIEIRRHLSP